MDSVVVGRAGYRAVHRPLRDHLFFCLGCGALLSRDDWFTYAPAVTCLACAGIGRADVVLAAAPTRPMLVLVAVHNE
jgi:hypothetical protein